MRPILSGFAQVAYATNDIAYAMDLYDKKYGISSFYQLDAQMPARVRGDEGVVSLKVGLANVAGVQIELMEPLSDLDGFFGSDLAGKSGFTLALHHFLQLVDGDLADWDAHVAELEGAGRDVVCQLHAGDSARVMFTDDRSMLGVYLEHIWMTPEAKRAIESQVPFHAGTMLSV